MTFSQFRLATRVNVVMTTLHLVSQFHSIVSTDVQMVVDMGTLVTTNGKKVDNALRPPQVQLETHSAENSGGIRRYEYVRVRRVPQTYPVPWDNFSRIYGVPNVFARTYYIPVSAIFNTRSGTLRVSVQPTEQRGSNSTSLLAGYQYCTSACKQASACWQASSGQQIWYVVHRTEQRCFGSSEIIQYYEWTHGPGTDGQTTLVYTTYGVYDGSGDTQDIRTTEIHFACNHSVHTYLSFTLLPQTVTEDFMVLYAQHQCACLDVYVSNPTCEVFGVEPREAFNDYAQAIIDAGSTCDTKYDINQVIFVALVCTGICIVADIAAGLYHYKKGGTQKVNETHRSIHLLTHQHQHEDQSVFRCICGGFCDHVIAPFFPEIPVTRMEQPILVVFGSATGGIMLFDSLTSIFVGDLPQGFSTITFAILTSVRISLGILPLVAGATCRVPSIGALVGFVYALYGSILCLDIVMCYGNSKHDHVAVISLTYIPSAVSFLICLMAFIKLLQPLGYKIYQRIADRIWRHTIDDAMRGDKRAETMTCKGGPTTNIINELPDTTSYVSCLLKSRNYLNFEEQHCTSGAHVQENYEVNDGVVPKTARHSFKGYCLQIYRIVLQKSSWITAGEVKILTAVVLALSILGGFTAIWAVVAEALAVLITSYLSGNRCCNGENCYAAVGAVVTGESAKNWIQPYEGFNGLFRFGDDDGAAIAFKSSCATFLVVQDAIYHTISGCAFASLAFCVWHAGWLFHDFRANVCAIQRGQGFERVVASASTRAYVASVKFVGTYVAYMTIGWLACALFLLIVCLSVAFGIVLPYYSITPGPSISLGTVQRAFWKEGAPQWLSIAIINYVAIRVIVILLRWTRRVALLRYFILIEQSLYVLTAVWAFVYRLVSSIFFQFLCMTRIDSKVLPSSVPKVFDLGYSLYLGLVSFDAFYSNKVMLAFVTMLLRDVRTLRSQRNQEDYQITDEGMWATDYVERAIVQ